MVDSAKTQDVVSERTRAAMKSALLESIANDPDVQAALSNLMATVIKGYDVGGVILESKTPPDAEQMKNILDLIDTRLRQQIRGDAFRRPTA